MILLASPVAFGEILYEQDSFGSGSPGGTSVGAWANGYNPDDSDDGGGYHSYYTDEEGWFWYYASSYVTSSAIAINVDDSVEGMSGAAATLSGPINKVLSVTSHVTDTGEDSPDPKYSYYSPDVHYFYISEGIDAANYAFAHAHATAQSSSWASASAEATASCCMY